MYAAGDLERVGNFLQGPLKVAFYQGNFQKITDLRGGTALALRILMPDCKRVFTMNTLGRLALAFALTVATTAIVGCENVALMPRPYLDLDEVVGQVERLDERNKELYVRPERGGTGMINYRETTRVVYEGREYPISYLQAGDIVAMQIKPGDRRIPYTDLIRIQERSRDRGDSSVARPVPRGTQTLDGTVEWVDSKRGVFEVREQSGRNVTVSLPFDARRADVDYLERLRTGDRVTIEGKFLNQDQFELETFLSARTGS